jgi:hypothetical protein
LTLETSRAIFFHNDRQPAYKLLAKDGTFIAIDSNTGPLEVCVATWSEALRQADTICADLIVKMHTNDVLFRISLPSGACIWMRACVFWHADFADEVGRTTYSQIEPLSPDVTSTTSGAARRRAAAATLKKKSLV